MTKTFTPFDNYFAFCTAKSCMEPAAPFNGYMSCDLMGDAGMECTAWCSDGYAFLEEIASVYTCRYGIWDPPRGKYFSFPTCASKCIVLISLNYENYYEINFKKNSEIR